MVAFLLGGGIAVVVLCNGRFRRFVPLAVAIAFISLLTG
jgi:hypothetical protein